jgi:DNA repair protein RadC
MKKDIIKISNSQAVFQNVKKHFDLYQENIILIGVNSKNEILLNEVIFKGGVNSSIIDLKIIYKKLLLNNCVSFFICHNHPSKNLTPSKEDFDILQKLKKSSEMLDLKFLDSIIFNDINFYSHFDNDDF